MGIYIKSMEMPTSCMKCLFQTPYMGEWCFLLDCNSNAYSRRCDCPLVPISKHGRLIDADALLNLLNNCMFPSDMVTTVAVRMATNWIKEAPTILEAEEET